MGTKRKYSGSPTRRWMHWRNAKSLLANQAAGTLLHYYATSYDSKLPALTTRKRVRAEVKRFVEWCGEPIKLASIDNALLRQFEQFEVKRGVSADVAGRRAAKIRHIVNDWQPGRLTTRKARELPAGPAGTVEHFVANAYLRATGRRGGNRASKQSKSKTINVVSRLHEFNGRKPVRFAKFTSELCEQFLRWCLNEGVNSDRVNTTYRFELVSISRDAVKAGLMKRRLYLDPVAPLKRRPRPSTNGHAKRATTSRNKGGRPAKWEHLKLRLTEYLREDPNATPAHLRSRYRAEYPARPLPSPKSSTLRVFTSELKRQSK